MVATTASAAASAAAGIRVLVIDDGRLNRECLTAQLEAHGLTTNCAWDAASVFAAIEQAAPNVILLNIAAPDGATLLPLSMDVDPGVKVIVFGLSADRESEIVACAEAGVAGLHLRSESLAHLLALIANAGNGRAQCSPEVSAILLRRVYSLAQQPDTEARSDLLTAREMEILELIEQGLTNQQIATRLSLALHTVKNHVHNLLTKLGVSTRAEAASATRALRYANPPAE